MITIKVNNVIKAILFDCYGTLISTGNGSVNATKRILKKLNFPFNAELFYKHWKKIHGTNINNLLKFKKEKDVFIDDLKMLYKYYDIKGNPQEDIIFMYNSLSRRHFFNDVISELKILKQKYKIYIASNSDTEPLMSNIKNKAKLFDGIFTSEYLTVYKPKTGFFNKILEKINCKNNEVIFVGDSLEDDINGAKNAGISAILIDRKKIYTKKETKENCVINGFHELGNIIQSYEI
jgi:2-haloalkanoic acid dehalogenase type II